jgi:phosphoadenosine phosphosulfate reductase
MVIRTVPKQLKKQSNFQSSMNLDAINDELRGLSPVDRIKWAEQTFGDNLYALTSAGVDSALILDHIAQTGTSVPIIHINTGFLPQATLDFRDTLEQLYDLTIYEVGPTEAEIDEINKLELWDTDPTAYSKKTKLQPLSRVIDSFHIQGLLTAVRSDQTDNRATLDIVGYGSDNELRIRPFIDWSNEQVNDYIESHGLPRNALYAHGFDSVADTQTTKRGKGRNGRALLECGLHVEGGTPILQEK